MSEILDALGEAFGTRNGTARTTAALLSNPGCERRAVLDAARVDLASVATRLGAPTQFGQSPFAIGQGNRFEQRIKDDGYEALAAAINELLHIFEGVQTLRSVSVERVDNLPPGRALLEARAKKTAEILEAIASGDPSAPHVVDHGVTTLHVDGRLVFLEQDALAFREGERLRICEIKGFPIIDGSADPSKVGAAARQTAVYLASIQDTLADRGLDPKLVSSEVILVCPKNFSIKPTAVRVDVERELRALRRQLRRRADIAPLLTRIEQDADQRDLVLLDLIADAADQAGKAGPGTPSDVVATTRVVELLPYRYAPDCLAACDLGRHCRACSQAADDPTRLGGDVAALLGGIDTVTTALDLAEGASPTPDQTEVAVLLQQAGRAIADATGSAP